MAHFGLQFKDTVYPGREVMAAELEVDWSYCNHNQKAESFLSFFFLFFRGPQPREWHYPQ